MLKGSPLLLLPLILMTPPSSPPTLHRMCFTDVLYGKDRACFVYTKESKDKYVWFTRKEYKLSFSRIDLHEEAFSASAWVVKDPFGGYQGYQPYRCGVGMIAAEFTCDTLDGGVFGLVWSAMDAKNYSCAYISPKERCAYVCNEINGQMSVLKRIPLDNNLAKREFIRIDFYPSNTAIHLNWEPVFYSTSLRLTRNLSYGFLQGRPRYNRITCMYFSGCPGDRIPPK